MRKFLPILFAVIFCISNAFGQTKPVDTDGDGYLNISNAEHMKWLSDSSWYYAYPYASKIELDNDIDLSESKTWNISNHDDNPNTPDSAKGWNPIGKEKTNGLQSIYTIKAFEGNGHEIKNLYINRPQESIVGLFANVGRVRNLTISNCFIRGQESVGCICGVSSSTNETDIRNCEVSGLVVGNSMVGGFLGHSSTSGVYILDCVFDGSVSGNENIGGLVGEGKASITDCLLSGNIRGKENIGGIVGYGKRIQFDNCSFDGNVTGENNVGGIVGSNEFGDGFWNISVTGTISGNNQIGGICGNETRGDSRYYDCSFIGTINAKENAGGIIGAATEDQYSTSSLYRCYSKAIINSNNIAGGLVGCNATLIERCFSEGSLTCAYVCGGVTAINKTSNTIHDCFSRCSISSQSVSGGIAGQNEGEIYNCYYAGISESINSTGGLIGTNTGIVENSFWDKNISGIDTSAGGTGLTTAQMKTKSTFTDAGWNFKIVWDIDGTTNDGYPFLRDVTVGIEDEVTPFPENEIAIYPNPAEDMIYVEVPEPVEGSALRQAQWPEGVNIYDYTGNVVYSGNAGEIGISFLPPGVYFVRMTPPPTPPYQSGEHSMTGKFVKR
jgi:hypothetical protein